MRTGARYASRYGGIYVVDDFYGSGLEETSHWWWGVNKDATLTAIDAVGGVWQFYTGTARLGQVSMWWWDNLRRDDLRFDGFCTWRCRCETSGANRTYKIGLSDTSTGVPGSGGEVYGTLSWTWNNADNSAQWQILQIDPYGIVRNTVNTSIALDTTAYHLFSLTIRCASPTASGTNAFTVTCYYDSVSAGSFTFPVSGDNNSSPLMVPWVFISQDKANISATLDADFVEYGVRRVHTNLVI